MMKHMDLLNKALKAVESKEPKQNSPAPTVYQNQQPAYQPQQQPALPVQQTQQYPMYPDQQPLYPAQQAHPPQQSQYQQLQYQQQPYQNQQTPYQGYQPPFPPSAPVTNQQPTKSGGDLLDKGVGMFLKKQGVRTDNKTTEKISDGLRMGFRKLTGKNIPIKDQEMK